MLACLLPTPLMCNGWDWRAGLTSSEAKTAYNIVTYKHAYIHIRKSVTRVQTPEPVLVAVGPGSDRSPHIDFIHGIRILLFI